MDDLVNEKRQKDRKTRKLEKMLEKQEEEQEHDECSVRLEQTARALEVLHLLII